MAMLSVVDGLKHRDFLSQSEYRPVMSSCFADIAGLIDNQRESDKIRISPAPLAFDDY